MFPCSHPQVCEPCHHFCLTCDGPSVRYCTSCRYFADLDGLCIDFCPQYAYGDNITKKCIQCHAECRGMCFGSSSLECNSCTNFKIYLDEEKQQVGVNVLLNTVYSAQTSVLFKSSLLQRPWTIQHSLTGLFVCSVHLSLRYVLFCPEFFLALHFLFFRSLSTTLFLNGLISLFLPPFLLSIFPPPTIKDCMFR